mgnify:CR=1 FL=1
MNAEDIRNQLEMDKENHDRQEREQAIKVAQIASNEPLTPLPEGIRANVLDEVIRKIRGMHIVSETNDQDELINHTYECVIMEIKKMK